MKIQFEIKNRQVFIAVLLTSIITLLTLAIAYGTSNPAVFGHSAGEIEGEINLLNSPIGLRSFDSCSDFTSNQWYNVDVSASVPASANYAVLETQCSEIYFSIRPMGSNWGACDLGSRTYNDVISCGCISGNDDADGQITFVKLDANKRFQIASRGTNCDTLWLYLFLIGWS